MATLAMMVRAFQGRRKKQERELLTIEGRINETFHLIARGNDGDNNNYNNGIGNSNDDDKNDVPTCYGSSLEECSHFSLRTL